MIRETFLIVETRLERGAILDLVFEYTYHKRELG